MFVVSSLQLIPLEPYLGINLATKKYTSMDYTMDLNVFTLPMVGVTKLYPSYDGRMFTTPTKAPNPGRENVKLFIVEPPRIVIISQINP